MPSKLTATRDSLRQLGFGDAAVLSSALGELSCDVRIGLRSYGDSFETYAIIFAASCVDLRRIAIALLACALGELVELYIPIRANCLAKGIKIVVARPSYSSRGQQKSFTYVPRRKLKRYPWYPSSQKLDPATELPMFGVAGVPGERDSLLWDNRRNLRKPYAIWIGGYPKGLIRLARLLLDYANTDIPNQEITLETEGGFRGVGPSSYEAQFERIDD